MSHKKKGFFLKKGTGVNYSVVRKDFTNMTRDTFHDKDEYQLVQNGRREVFNKNFKSLKNSSGSSRSKRGRGVQDKEKRTTITEGTSDGNVNKIK